MELTTRLLKPTDVQNAASLVAKEFTRAEPLTVAMNLAFEEYFPVALKVCEKVLGEGFSFGAFDKEGELIACVVACDFTTPPPENLAQLFPKVAPVYALLGELDEHYIQNYPVAKGENLHVLFAAVNNDYSGQGLYQRLRAEVHKNAANCGYQFVLGEVTGTISQKVTCEKFNHEVIKTISYAEYEFENNKAFSSISNPAHCCLVRGNLV